MLKKLFQFCLLLISVTTVFAVRHGDGAVYATLSRKDKRKVPKGLTPRKKRLLVTRLLKEQAKKELNRFDRKCFAFKGGSLIEQNL